jgi:hypothetical protein
VLNQSDQREIKLRAHVTYSLGADDEGELGPVVREFGGGVLHRLELLPVVALSAAFVNR